MSGKQQPVFWGHFSGLRDLSKRSYDRKPQCILRARGKGWTSEFGGTPSITTQTSHRGTLNPEWYLLRHRLGAQFHGSLCPMSSVPGIQSGAKQEAVGFTLKEMEASLLPLMKEKASLPPHPPRKVRIHELPVGKRGMGGVITFSPAICLLQSNGVSVQLHSQII